MGGRVERPRALNYSFPVSAAGEQAVDYKVYFLGDDGHIRSAADIECESDAAAVEQATKIAKGATVTLWCRARRIAIINERQDRPA
jgi:hypothetical protein